jgi:ATP-dependent helicase/nuclease subunit B
MNLFDIPAHCAFLDSLAAGVLHAQAGAAPERLARITILLPTRRSARALRAAFVRAVNGEALLLPRMRAIAGLSTEDADELALPGLLDLPPAVEKLRRQAVLAGFVEQWQPRHGGPGTPQQAWSLAGELATLLDEIALEEPDLVLLEAAPTDQLVARWLSRLTALVPEQHAQHWQVTLLFLRGVFEAWQGWLTKSGLLDIGMRRVQALQAQTRAWAAEPPEYPVIAAGVGVGGTIPAAAALLRVLAGAPNGAVVLQGVDRTSTEEVWDAIRDAPTHPNCGQQRLLAALGARRDDVRLWPGVAPPGRPGFGQAPAGRPALGFAPTAVPIERPALLAMALRPAAGLPSWPEPLHPACEPALAGLSLLTAPDSQAEAMAIALTLREALEQPAARAALVTPDRDLARRVAAELARFGIIADDSAGAPLADAPASAFLRLMAAAVGDELAPVPLLSVLKHPLCCGGMDRTDWMAAVRRLEWHVLRGPRPGPGLGGLRAAVAASLSNDKLARQAAQVASLLAALDSALGGFGALPDFPRAPPAALLAAHLAAAEALAGSNTQPGGLRLYAGEEGEALAQHLADLQLALQDAAPIAPSAWPALFDATLAGAAAPSLHGSTGRPNGVHPRVEILGLLEARLLTHDCVVLGALDETVWPLVTDPGPWMSRPMRREFGLPEPEARIGRVAADFLLGSCAARRVVLSRAERRGGTPTVPARWLTRLETYLAGQRSERHPEGLKLPTSPAAAWAALLDQPDIVAPCRRPAPRPSADQRPMRLSVTEVETLIADPYAFYARRVLKLRALDALDAEVGAADYGMLVHDVLNRFIPRLLPWPGLVVARDWYAQALEAALAESGVRPGFAAYWRPRLARIGEFVLDEEAAVRTRDEIARSFVECTGALELHHADGRLVTLTARADRIDLLRGGGLALLDYKTGTPPTSKQVADGHKPQLTLEAAIAQRGGFRDVPAEMAQQLVYWKLSGGLTPGQTVSVKGAIADLADAALAELHHLVTAFLWGERAFLARPHPNRKPAGSDYDHLSRLAEWSGSEDGEGEE